MRKTRDATEKARMIMKHLRPHGKHMVNRSGRRREHRRLSEKASDRFEGEE